MSPLLKCSGVGGGFCLAKLAAAEQTGAVLLCSCEAKPKQRKATLYFSFTAFATASRALRVLARSKKKKYGALIFYVQI